MPKLAEWVPLARPYHVEPGELIAEQGEAPKGLQLLLAGEALALLVDQGRTEPVGRHTGPTWMGAIAVLTGGALGVRMQAETACRMAVIDAEDFRRLAFAQPAIHRRVMRQVAPVMSRVTEMRAEPRAPVLARHDGRGPCARAEQPGRGGRGAAASQLTEALEVIGSAMAHFVEAGVERQEAEQLVRLQQRGASPQRDLGDGARRAGRGRRRGGGARAPGSAGRRGALAAGRAAWRRRASIEQWLDRVQELAGSATDAALRWVAATLTAGRLAAELSESTERMSTLVGAVKSYAYMDRGGLVEVDLHEGIETTLTVLGYKLKHTSIALVRDYDRDAAEAHRPRIGAEPGVDQPARQRDRRARAEQGTITITTRSRRRLCRG